MKSALIFSGLLVVAIIWCQKPVYDLEGSNTTMAPIVFYTSLADTLPKRTFEKLGLRDRVVGVKINNLTGMDVRYFQYEADPDVLIKALSETPFDINTQSPADIQCHEITYGDLTFSFQNVSDAESNYAASFLNSFHEGYEVYECVKSPLKHQVLIQRNTNRVFHRIEKIG
jgi:hypothetical protein